MSLATERSLAEQVTRDIVFYQPPPGVEAVVTGTPYSDVELMKEMNLGKLQMTILAFAVIFVFLSLLYRSMGKAAVPLIPIVLNIGWNGATMYLLGIEYNILTATMGAMTIGVAAEYCIMMVERIYEEMETHDTLTAVLEGTGKIGAAITVSATATMAAFSTLIVSDFPIISVFGIVTVIAMAFTLFGAIVAVPAAASLLLRGSGQKASSMRRRMEAEVYHFPDQTSIYRLGVRDNNEKNDGSSLLRKSAEGRLSRLREECRSEPWSLRRGGESARRAGTCPGDRRRYGHREVSFDGVHLSACDYPRGCCVGVCDDGISGFYGAARVRGIQPDNQATER